MRPHDADHAEPPPSASSQPQQDDDDAEDPNDPYGDGFGDDLMGDDDDRARLAGMTELEREEILADRRDARAKIQDRKRIIQMAREKKEREAGGKKKFKPSDVRKKTLEDAKGKSSRAQALADIAKKKDASRRRAADREDDDDDDDEYGSDDDVSLEDEELTGILPQREKRAPRSRRAAGDSEDDYSDEDDEEGGGDRVPASEIQIRSIVLTRDTLSRWITEPFVETCAPGCFVRISVGVNRHTGENKYALGEIVGVAEGKHKAYNLKEYEYPHKGSGKWTNKWLLLRYGRDERAFMIAEVSNSPVTDAEYGAWRAQLEKDGVKFPQLRDINAAQSNIKSAQDYRYTSEDIQKMLSKRAEKRSGLQQNLASQKENIRRLIERAKMDGDDEAVANLEEQMAQVMEKLKVRLDKGGTAEMMAAINKKNNAVNDQRLSRIASEQVARAKSGAADQSANDPFSRRPTKAATYYAIGKGKEGAEDGEEKPKTPAAVKTAAGGADAARAPKTPRAGLNSYSVAAQAKRDVIVRAHDVDVSVHPALAGGEDPMLSKGLRKGLIPVLRRAMLGGRGLLAADTRPAPVKTLSLHEYKARLDQMDE